MLVFENISTPGIECIRTHRLVDGRVNLGASCREFIINPEVLRLSRNTISVARFPKVASPLRRGP